MSSPPNDVYEFGPYRLDAGERALTLGHERVPWRRRRSICC